MQDTTLDLHGLLAAMPGGGVLLDPEGHILAASPEAARRLGDTPEGLQGVRLSHLAADGCPGLDPALVAASRSSGEARLRLVLRRDHGSGAVLALRLRAVRRAPDGRAVALLATLQTQAEAMHRLLDLNGRLAAVEQEAARRQRAEARLAEQLAWTRVVLNSIGDAVLTTDRLGQVTWMNPVSERLTGWSREQATGLPLGRVFHIVNEHTREPVPDPVQRCLAQGRIVGLANHTVLIARDGREFGIEDSAAPIRSEQGEVHGVVLVFHDVTEQRRLAGELSHRARHDGLTGAINRSEFEQRLVARLAAHRRTGGLDALLFIDLDQFKLVNDSAGHAVGDRLLRQLADLIASCLPCGAETLLARIGGDEFAVLIENEDPSLELARRTAQRICDEVTAFRFVHAGRRFQVGASIGLVPLDRRWPSEAAFLQAADAACYAAKQDGGNRVRRWCDDDASLQQLRTAAKWVHRIEEAIEAGRFVLYGQRFEPVHGQAGGLHAEVLLRMLDRDGSLILPAAFLPAAERFHLAARIDRWVLTAVLAWLNERSQQLESISLVSVNLSGQSLGDRAFRGFALDLLAGVTPSVRQRLCLELTETAAVSQPLESSRFIDEVRALGVRVALDDFGAGASAFAYLKRLHVDYLKIDGQYVRGLLNDPLDEATVRCFVDVARAIGARTVAEFVEDEGTRERLAEFGVDYLQGHLLARPVPLAEIALLLEGAPPDGSDR
jgi:diguanylate cyclase (GGDEF)-like protein/PAS domain S-box-containing protein